MKPKLIRNLFVSAVAMTFAPQLLFSAPSTSATPAGTAPVAQRMQQLDQRLDSVFADTFRGFGNAFSDSAFASSIDLRDQQEKYVVRVYVPDANTSKVNATVEGDTLRVTASGEETTKNSSQSARYEQMITLPGPVQSDKMKIERKQNLVVIDLPKAKGATANSSPVASPGAGGSGSNFAGVDENIIRQMARMQRQMNQLFDQTFPDEESGFTNDSDDMQFGSAVHVDDLKDSYVVHFNLPDKNLQDVSVKLDGDQLRLTAAETAKQADKNTSAFRSGDYVQVMTLPGPVEKKGMKVERQNGTIVVTLPKAA